LLKLVLSFVNVTELIGILTYEQLVKCGVSFCKFLFELLGLASDTCSYINALD